MTPRTAASIADGAAELLAKLDAQAANALRSHKRIGAMGEAELEARLHRELDRLIACAQVVVLDQVSIELSHNRPRSGPAWQGD